MNIKFPEGKHVLAVSGGVDSMTLLDMLAQRPRLQLIIAHFNHGMRSDAKLDEELAAKMASQYSLPFEVGYGELGIDTSEATARQKRYEFLNAVAKKHQTDGIIAAHHQDDLVETAFINIIRGSGPRGLTAITTNPKVLRPLINIPKVEILNYARAHHLQWREDTTNYELKYLRNYLRNNTLVKLPELKKQKLVKNIEKVAELNHEKEILLATISHILIRNHKINRDKFKLLPSAVANELIVYWLREMGAKEYDKKTIERLNVALRTAAANTKHPVKSDFYLEVDSKTAQLTKTA
jgi:tRNA(Ile)-lysidine synthetase-like protein